MRIKAGSFRAFYPLIIGFIFCSPFILESVLCRASSAQKVEMVDGVRIVHNKKGGEWGNNQRISIELIRTIGDVNTADENLAFDSPLDMAVDDTGNIYILDSGNHRVQKFSPEGEYVAAFGRKGQGPGEFSRPISIDVDAKGFLYVLDRDLKKIQVLTPESEDHKVILTTKLNLDRFRLLAPGSWVARSYGSSGVPGAAEEKAKPKLIMLLDADLSVIKEFGEPFDFGNEMTTTFGNSVQFEVDNLDNIYLSFAFQNRVEKYTPEGRLLWRADRKLNYSTKVIERGKQEITKTRTRYTSPRMNRVSAGLAADDKGRVWVVTYNRQFKKEEEVGRMVTGSGGVATTKILGNTDLQTTDMFKLEIYSPNGVLLGEIPLTQFVDMIHIWKDKLFLLDRDRGVKFYEYRITEK